MDLISKTVYVFSLVYGASLQNGLQLAAWMMRSFLYVYCAVGIISFTFFALCVLLDHRKFKENLKIQKYGRMHSILAGMFLSLVAGLFWIFFLPQVFIKMRRMIR